MIVVILGVGYTAVIHRYERMNKTFVDPRKFFNGQIGIVQLTVAPAFAENIAYQRFLVVGAP